MRFLIDACAGGALGRWLAEQGHDVVDLSVDGAPGVSDETILARAAEERRIVVTMDKDFGELVGHRLHEHAGLVRLPSVRNRRRIEIIGQVLALHALDLEGGAAVTVRGKKMRVSKPPHDAGGRPGAL